jgi:hypothetical protein
MKCRICGKGPMDGVTLFRANEKGVIGIWECAIHHFAPVPDDVADIVTVIEQDNRDRRRNP